MLKKGAIFGLDARITMLIIALLGLLVFPYFGSVVSQSKAEALLTTSRNVSSAIESYILDTGSYPATIANLYDTQPTKASQQASWNGPYLKGHKDDAFTPNLNWTVLDSDCTSGSAKGRTCRVRVSYEFCGFSSSVYDAMGEVLQSNNVMSYDSASKCITYNYGYSGSTVTYLGFKVRELP